MSALITTFFMAALGEMGDKTQLVALSLASSSRKPITILAGDFAGTLLNHVLASYLGGWLARFLPQGVLAIAAACLFIFFGLWALRGDGGLGLPARSSAKSFVAVAGIFFLAEMGDKTQILTLTLAAVYKAPVLAAIGATLGVMVSDALAIGLGDVLARRVSAKTVRWVSAGLFFTSGIVSLFRLWNAICWRSVHA